MLEREPLIMLAGVWQDMAWSIRPGAMLLLIVCSLIAVLIQAIRLGMLGQAARLRQAELEQHRQISAMLYSSIATNRALLNAMPDILFRINREGRFVNFWSTQSDSLWADSGNFLNQHIRDVLPEQIAEPLLEAIVKVLDGAGLQVFEYEIEIAATVLAFEARIVASEIDETILIVRDITERKRVEEELRRARDELEQRVVMRTGELARANDLLKQEIAERRLAEQRYRELFEDAPMQYLITRDRPGGPVIADCNQAFQESLGYSREQLIGRPLADLYTPASQEEMLNGGYRRALEGVLLAEERELITSDGRVLAMLMRSSPEIDPEGWALGTRAMYTDITERKRAEVTLAAERQSLAERVAERTHELREANAQLARAVRLKDEFLANMSHELRTPLATILGFTEALQLSTFGPLNERQQIYLRTIEESGQHLLSLINDVLDLSKIEAGKILLEQGNVAVQQLCDTSLRLAAQTALQKRITVSVDLVRAPATIYGDERRLKQILVNMLSNAVKFTPEGGAVGLEIVKEGTAEAPTVRLTVWDTGIGIAEDQLQSLFQPFVQLDSRLARQYEGTGLGLALVSKLARLHGGNVEVTSTLGQGSRFSIVLPAPVDVPAVQPQEASERREVGKGLGEQGPGVDRPRSGTILLADDHDAGRQIVSDYLTAHGYRVEVARNGLEAVERAQQVRPDAILLDIQMPGMDGLEAARCMRANPQLARLPIIALTALAMPGDRERCLAVGMTDYLSKPIPLSHVVRVLDRYIRA